MAEPPTNGRLLLVCNAIVPKIGGQVKSASGGEPGFPRLCGAGRRAEGGCAEYVLYYGGGFFLPDAPPAA